MIVNRESLLIAAPIKNMLKTKEKLNGFSYGMSEAGYDIRIKQDIEFYSKCLFVDEQMFAGNFCIASAMEEFDMPTNLVGVVHDKSSWARKGLSVFNTIIEPGWKGFLTLELVYHGKEDLKIPAGTGIAQVVFHKTTNYAAYDGKYQNQANKPQEAIYDKS